MIYAQEVGLVAMIEAQDAGTGADTVGIADTIGADYISVDVSLGAHASKPATIKLQESDQTEATTFQDIPEMVGDGPEGFAIADPDPANPQTYRLNLALNGRGRYIQAVFRPSGTAQPVAVNGALSRANSEIRNRSTVTHDA